MEGDSKMDGKDKNAKKNPAEKAEGNGDMENHQCKTNWKIIAGIFVLVIIMMYTFGNMTENSISEKVAKEFETFKAELQTVKSALAGFDTRLSEAEKGTVDIDAVKEDIASIKKAGEDFNKKLLSVIKAEELKLTELEKGAADQKAYIDELKSLLEGPSK